MSKSFLRFWKFSPLISLTPCPPPSLSGILIILIFVFLMDFHWSHRISLFSCSLNSLFYHFKIPTPSYIFFLPCGQPCCTAYFRSFIEFCLVLFNNFNNFLLFNKESFVHLFILEFIDDFLSFLVICWVPLEQLIWILY